MDASADVTMPYVDGILGAENTGMTSILSMFDHEL